MVKLHTKSVKLCIITSRHIAELMYIKVTAIPRAKKSEIVELSKDHLKVRLLSPPIKNRANKELTELLADYYGIPKSAVKIIRGEHSREKFVEISIF